MKVAINTCFGGFNLSHKAIIAYAKRKGLNLVFKPDNVEDDTTFVHYYTKEPMVEANYYDTEEIYHSRADIDIIAVIEDLGQDADGRFAKLKIVTIPDDVEYTIEDYDGLEHIAEQHRTWS